MLYNINNTKNGVKKMKEMKEINSKSANVMANIALGFSKLAANSRCVFIYHQPKMPSSLKKLRKH